MVGVMGSKNVIWRALLAIPLLWAAGGVKAADLPSIKSPDITPAQPVVPPGYLFNLQPWGADLGRTLQNYGVYVTGRTINEGFDNISGGIKQGPLYEGYTSLGLDFDTHKLLGLPKGGGVHFLVSGLQGQPYWNYSGSVFAFNRVWTYNDAVRLNGLSYEQKLFNDKVDISFGRMPLGFEFDAGEIYCLFVNGLCTFPPGLTYGKGNPAYLTASYAALVKVALPQHFYFNVGAYADQPDLSTVGHYDWPGRDWDVDNLTGVTVPMQVGYSTDFTNDPLPRAYSIGGFIDTGHYADPYYNNAGEDRLLYGGAARSEHGKTGIWLQAQQMVWRPDPDSTRGLTLFGGANFRTSGDYAIDNDYFAGALLRGTFASRPNDTIGLMGMMITENGAYTKTLIDKLALADVSQYSISSNEPFVELNYGMAVAPGVTFKPFFQYIWNPDQDGITPVRPNLTHAVFVGAAITANWADTFGLPRMQLSGM